MSDFFIGGLLVFSLLLPILLRPFFRGMHALGGIPVLAVPAVFLCAGLLVTGTRLLFFPLFAFTVLVLLSQTGRMISLARGLPSDWFSAGTKALSVLGLAILAVLAFFSVRWIPEPLYLKFFGKVKFALFIRCGVYMPFLYAPHIFLIILILSSSFNGV